MRREMCMLRKISILAAIFLIFTSLVIFCPLVTQLDRSIIIFLQNKLNFVPVQIFMLPDCILYTIMLILPITGFGIYFLAKKLYRDAALFCTIPLVTYVLNCIIKHIISRPRPPFELQIAGIHPDSYSYVSTHSLVTICVWGLVIWYLYKFCQNKNLRICETVIAVLWILFVGLSRIMIGVHNPSDVLGAYMLGAIFLTGYINYLSKTS